MKGVAKLIVSIAVPLIVGFTASLFTITGVKSWYQSIRKPTWNPPDWVFAPVWTTLYVLMGIALFLIWRSQGKKQKRTAIILFIVQLIANFFWSFIFFDRHQIALALGEIIVLWLLVLLTIFYFARINKVAAWLLVPYVSWVTFAVILNFTIWQLNK
jgi:tryptophan-rich sensory protein